MPLGLPTLFLSILRKQKRYIRYNTFHCTTLRYTAQHFKFKRNRLLQCSIIQHNVVSLLVSFLHRLLIISPASPYTSRPPYLTFYLPFPLISPSFITFFSLTSPPHFLSFSLTSLSIPSPILSTCFLGFRITRRA